MTIWTYLGEGIPPEPNPDHLSSSCWYVKRVMFGWRWHLQNLHPNVFFQNLVDSIFAYFCNPATYGRLQSELNHNVPYVSCLTSVIYWTKINMISNVSIWRFPKMGGTPRSCIFVGCSITNHSLSGTPMTIDTLIVWHFFHDSSRWRTWRFMTSSTIRATCAGRHRWGTLKFHRSIV